MLKSTINPSSYNSKITSRSTEFLTRMFKYNTKNIKFLCALPTENVKVDKDSQKDVISY